MNIRTMAAGLLLWGIVMPAAADTLREIGHLLAFVSASGCTYVRNGTRYDAVEARQHIERKYDYVRKRISTTEEFIRYAATGSSMSGEPYQVICAGHEEPSADWLKRELARYRASTPDGNR